MKKLFIILSLIFFTGFFFEEYRVMPVLNATDRDWNSDSFWYYPWGNSGTHKGIDIFARAGTPVLATTGGVVLYQGDYGRGGTVVFLLGAKWRIHYYAHMEATFVHMLSIVEPGQRIGIVGTTGNARGRPPHLHYTIKSLFPLVWNYGFGKPSAADRMFYLDPGKFLQGE